MRPMTLGDATHGTGAHAPVLLPGDPRQVGGVRLLGRLGQGGMGVVFVGEDGTGRRVCVKLIRAEYALDPRFLARFAAEAEAARRVARFCTAQVIEAGTDGDRAYLVTEFIEGPTLTAALAQDGPMRGSTLDSLAIGIAAALNGIHAAGVVHRDLKPSNVLLSRVGPKVIDFGIARALDALERLTESGNVVGTPSYMAPEQFRGTTTTATDIFSWGAVVTFAATGRPPFGTGAAYQLMHRILAEPPDLGTLERPLRDLVTQALDKEPERRPTARALLLALVGDAGDPIDASSRILSTQWTAPAVTRLDDSGVAGPLLDRPLIERTSARSWRRRALLAVAAVALVVVAIVLTVKGGGDGSPDGAGNPSGAASASVSATSTTASPPASADPPGAGPVASDDQESTDAWPTIVVDHRVPATGSISLGVGDIRHYRLHLDQRLDMFVTGDSCSDLVRWQLFHLNAGAVGDGNLCGQRGPFTLEAGDYELRVGALRVGGKYSFTLTGR
jgi:serine/threonine protein kinase